jgi:light-regulated signal transduction histidine kinase (bacteriophytochrome)
LSNLKNIVLVVSPNEQIIYINPFGKEILVKDSAGEGLSVRSIFDSVSHYNAFAAEALAPSLQGNLVKDHATVFKTHSGEKIDVLLSAQLITNNKQVQGLLVVANDVTELSKTLRDLEKSNKELEQFAYVASHDLQEPLRKMSAYLHLLEAQFKDKIDEKAMAYIQIAVKSGSQMRSLIQDLLEYSNIAANNENNGSTDMNEVVEKVTKTLGMQIEELGAQIVSEGLPVLHQVNATQMEQLVQNLLSNGLKYHSDKKPHIKIYAEDSGEYWQFAIEDNGIGIGPQYREKVFVVFQRLHSKGQYPGTGIGLSICKKIIEQHGGRIWIDSNEHGGSTFFFTIPKNLPRVSLA